MVVITNEELCAAGSDHAVLSWITPGRKVETTVYMGEAPERLVKYTGLPDTEYHFIEVRGLKPSTRYWYSVEGGGARGPLSSFRTLPPPEGKHLFSAGLISDTHATFGDSVNDVNEKYLGKLNEYSGHLFQQCVRDMQGKNVSLALIVGDLTDAASQRQYQGLRHELLPAFGSIPYVACIGNHDKYLKHNGLGEQGFLKYAANRGETRTSFDVMGCRFLLLDSCLQDKDWGYIGEEQLRWLEERLQEWNAGPAFLFLHHPCNGLDVWLGVRDFRRLQRTIRRFPQVRGVFCGHMHRHKISASPLVTGNLPYVELPATVQFPCSYGIMSVYEKGFEYNAYKISRLDLSEMSRERTIFKQGGKALFTLYSFGGIGDRSVSFMNGRLTRHKQYELSATVGHAEAMELYGRAQSAGGASCAAAAEKGLTRVVLGRHDSLRLAFSARLQKIPLHGVKASITREGSYSLPEKMIPQKR